MKKFIPYIILLSVTLVIACCKGDDRRHDDIQYTNILNTNLAETVNTDSPTISIREHEMEIRRLQTKYIIALIVIVLVSILVYFVFLTKLNRKNIAIIRQAKETEQAEKLSAQALRQMPRERLDLDQLLYSKLLDMMEGEQKPYTDLTWLATVRHWQNYVPPTENISTGLFPTLPTARRQTSLSLTIACAVP